MYEKMSQMRDKIALWKLSRVCLGHFLSARTSNKYFSLLRVYRIFLSVELSTDDGEDSARPTKSFFPPTVPGDSRLEIRRKASRRLISQRTCCLIRTARVHTCDHEEMNNIHERLGHFVYTLRAHEIMSPRVTRDGL